jgi:hypothetical protein
MTIEKEVGWEDIANTAWSGAWQVVDEIEKQGRETEAMGIIEDTFSAQTPTDVQVNDFIRFELSDIMHLWND